MTRQLGKDLGDVTRQVQRARGLTRHLIASGREQAPHIAPLDVNALITGMTAMLGELIGTHIDILLVLQPDVSPALADRGQLEQVVRELVVNAGDAMPGGGSVTIETADVELEDSAFHEEAIVEGQYVMLAITDAAREVTQEIRQGSGLDLSTTYDLVKESNGYIWVYSEPGGRTTFKVYLPRATRSVPIQTFGSVITTPAFAQHADSGAALIVTSALTTGRPDPNSCNLVTDANHTGR